MELNFNYTAQLLSFCEILALSAVLSVVVMYIVEMLKKIILTTNSRIFTLLCFVISMAFGYLWAKTFAKEAINTSYALWLGLGLWLGANGFYSALENSNSFLGKTVKSYSEYLKNTDISIKQPIRNESVESEETQKQDQPTQTPQHSQEPTQQEEIQSDKLKYSIGQRVYFLGGYHYESPTSTKASGGLRSAGYAKLTYISQTDIHPYHLQGESAGSDVYGWVDETLVTDKAPEATKFRYPVNYIAISVPFSSKHYAVDFGWNASYGGPNVAIYSAFAGIVDEAGYVSGGAGIRVRVRFDDKVNNCTWYAIYKHLSKITVSVGQNVSMGQQLGNMGCTGDSDGEHLHFDLIKVAYKSSYIQTESSRKQYSVDPIKFLYCYENQLVGDVTDSKYNILRA